MKWLDLVKMLAPIVLATIPKAAMLAPMLIQGISEAEQIKGATGPQKKAHVLGLVAAGVAGLNASAGRTVIEPTAASATASAAIDTTVGVINLVHTANAATTAAPGDVASAAV